MTPSAPFRPLDHASAADIAAFLDYHEECCGAGADPRPLWTRDLHDVAIRDVKTALAMEPGGRLRVALAKVPEEAPGGSSPHAVWLIAILITLAATWWYYG